MYVSYSRTVQPGQLIRYSDGIRVRRLGFNSWQRHTASRQALGPIQPLVQWVAGFLSPGAKPPGREADNSPPSNAEVKNGGAIPPISHTSMF
jgi:hypothetical protein